MDALHNINNNRMMLNGITDFRSYNTGNAVGSTRNTPSVYQNNLGMLNSGTASYNDMMLSQLLSGGFASGTTSSQSNKTSALEIFATVMTGIASLAAVVL